MATAKHRPEEMRQRVNLFMSKLSDRDTEAMAAAELESIARGLTADALPPFVSAVGDTRPTDKTPLRRHSLRLLSLLTHSFPPAALAPHLPRILSAALRRLRDPDSSVRTALVDAVRSLAAASPPSVLVPAILRPLADALLHEQDLNPQSASACSLAAALDETTTANADLAGYLHRLLPRLVKLVRSPAFKAKPALLTLLGSAVAGGGIDGDASALQILLPCLVEFLSSEDWSARKAAAEALTRLAVAERDRLVVFKPSYLVSFEARRYDKVKIVRDSINRMMEVWKEIPDRNLNAPEFQPNSLKENASDGRFPLTSINSSSSVQSSTPFGATRSKQLTSRSPPPTASPIFSSAKKIVRPSSDLKPNSTLSRRMTQAKNSDWRIEISVPDAEIKEKGGRNGEQGRADVNGNGRTNLEARRVLFEKNCEEKKMDALKSGIRVVPLQENVSLEVTGETSDELIVEQKGSDLSLIRMQLVQIEKQQSTLLELLQKFISSSQNGIHSLEARVNSLETTLDEISHNLAVSSSRASNGGPPASKTCCRLPGTEFLSSKFWKRTDSRYASRFLPDINDFGNRDAHNAYQWNKQKFGFTNPLAEINPCSRGNLQFTPKRLQEIATGDTGSKFVQDG